MRYIFIFIYVLNYWFQDKPIELGQDYFMVSKEKITNIFSDTIHLTINSELDSFINKSWEPSKINQFKFYGKIISFNLKDSLYMISDFEIETGFDDNPGISTSSPGGYYTKDKLIIDNVHNTIQFNQNSIKGKNYLYYISEKTNTTLTLMRIKE